MKTILVILFLLTTAGLSAQNSPEQSAFDYFFTNIFSDDYGETKLRRIGFSGHTQEELSSFGIFKPCFEDLSIYTQLAQNLESKSIVTSIDIDYSPYKEMVKFKKAQKKYNLYIWRASKLNESYFVQINMEERNQGIDAYYFELDENGNVLNWCRTGLIW